MGEMESLRRYYGVPAKRGARVAWTYNGTRREGVISSARQHKLWVRFDDGPPGDRSGPFHPTWQMEYL